MCAPVAGKSVAKYIGNRSPRNTQIVALGVDAYLKMLLHDNFVHTDLHPGNILVGHGPAVVVSPACCVYAQFAAETKRCMCLWVLVGLSEHEQHCHEGCTHRPEGMP